MLEQVFFHDFLNEPLLRLGTLMLTRLGYSVTGCRNGLDAMAALASPSEPYAAILTDWVMDGSALVEAVSRQHPHLPIVVCSGYGDSVLPATQGLRHLCKPYTLLELKNTLDEVLAA